MNDNKQPLIDRRISVGNIIAVAGCVATCMAFAFKTDAKIQINSAKILLNTSKIESMEKQTDSKVNRIYESLQRIEAKLDKKADK